jgi:hypothetical protein
MPVEAGVAIIIALCGALVGWQGKRLKKLEAKISKLTAEVEARYHQEQIACETISTVTGIPIPTIKITLRKETKDRCGIYPSMSLGDLR